MESMRCLKVYKIYTYLSHINLKSLIKEINDDEMNVLKISKLKNKLVLMIREIDGAIVSLDKIIDENSKSEDIFSNELFLMLGTTVLDNAFLRKLNYSLIYSILQDKTPKDKD